MARPKAPGASSLTPPVRTERGEIGMKQKKQFESGSPYCSRRELAERWRCARSSVDRIARRAKLTRVCLGTGRNGIVRYLRKEVEKFEESRSVGPAA
jgi:hypothetical protein